MSSRPSDLSADLTWQSLPEEYRDLLRGKLVGLWGWPDDASVFDSLSLDKKQGLLLLAARLSTKELWAAVKSIENVYGEGGVGIDFEAWPFLLSELRRRRDFTSRFAKPRAATAGFYERHRANGVLHILFHRQRLPHWHAHFDFFSPVFSVGTALKHLRHEYFGKLRPDWKMITKLK